jgi:Pentapeptide repeats (8 copies)
VIEIDNRNLKSSYWGQPRGLTGAVMHGADINGTVILGVDMTGAVMPGADIRGVDMLGAVMLEQLQSVTKLYDIIPAF